MTSMKREFDDEEEDDLTEKKPRLEGWSKYFSSRYYAKVKFS